MNGDNLTLAVLLDDARAALFAADLAGLQTRALLVSVDDYRTVEQAARMGHHRERPLRLLGVELLAQTELTAGAIRLLFDDDSATAAT